MEQQYLHDTICFYHKNCMDGLGAAWVVWKFFKGQVDLVPFQYGDPIEPVMGENYQELIGKKVICVDLSFDLKTTKTIGRVCDFLVLDHHDTAQRELSSVAYKALPVAKREYLAAGKSLSEFNEEELTVVVDNDISGARMAWNWFFGGTDQQPPQRPPLAILYVEDYDLWRFNYAITKSWNAAAASNAMTVEQFDTYVSNDPVEQRRINDHMEMEGKAIQRYIEKTARSITRGAKRFKMDEYDVPAVNANSVFRNEVGNILSAEEPFSISYTDSREGRQYSLRSKRGGVHVGDIAKRFGGGGHANSAAFTIKMTDEFFHLSHLELCSKSYAIQQGKWVETNRYIQHDNKGAGCCENS